MTPFFARLAACLVATVLLAGCGPSETDQRQAFIEFLQKDVLAKKGIRVPALTEERRKALGDYAAQYEIITRFHETMNASVAKPLQEAVSRGSPGTIAEVVSRRADIETIRGAMATTREALDKAKAAADEARAALKQPDDLAQVYGQAFDKLVTQSATAFRPMFQATDDAAASMLTLADLIEKNRAAIKLDGSMIEVNDAKLRAQAQALMDGMNDKRRKVDAAADGVRRMMYGQ